jgi:hypothetical protein
MGVAMARGDRACLRMATALYPDIVLLDPRLPRSLLCLLRAHPFSKHAHVGWSCALATAARPDLNHERHTSTRVL